MPATTLSASHVVLKDDLTFGSSTDVAVRPVALTKSSWKRDTFEGSSSSSTHKSDRSMSHAVLIDDGKGRSRTAALERGGRKDPASFLAISSSSSSSSYEDDDDCYGPVNSSSRSQAVGNMSRDLRTHNSRTPSSSISTTPPKYTNPPPSKFPAVPHNNGSRFSESEEEEEEEEEDEGDDEEENKDDDEDEDDDIPLAKSIPGALTAQKYIRRQVRQDREKKKQAKALRDHAETTRTRMITMRPGATPTSSHDAAAAMDRNSRSSTKNGSRSLNPLSPEDSARKRDISGTDGAEAAVDAASLYQRLHSLRGSKSMTRSLRDVRSPSTEALPPVPFPQSRSPGSQTQSAKSAKDPSSMPYHYHTSPLPTPINSTYAPSSTRPLRPMRSFHFHRPSTDHRPIGMDDPNSVPLPLDAENKISQNSNNFTRSRPSTREGPKQQTSTFVTATPTHHRSLPGSIPEPVPPIPTTSRINLGEHHNLFLSSIITYNSSFFLIASRAYKDFYRY